MRSMFYLHVYFFACSFNFSLCLSPPASFYTLHFLFIVLLSFVSSALHLFLYCSPPSLHSPVTSLLVHFHFFDCFLAFPCWTEFIPSSVHVELLDKMALGSTSVYPTNSNFTICPIFTDHPTKEAI